MALSKTIDTQYGVSANYHKITVSDINWHDKYARIKIGSFVDSDKRAAGANAISTTELYWSGGDFSFDINANILAQFYIKLKTLDQWSDSIDV